MITVIFTNFIFSGTGILNRLKQDIAKFKRKMRQNKTSVSSCVRASVLCFLVMLLFSYAYASDPAPGTHKPFRILIIIGDQWDDPAGYVVSMPEPTGAYSGYDAKPEVSGNVDFHHLVVLLKSWGIPFDVVRLDQQILDRYMLLDMHGNPMYGTVIWDVNRSEKLVPADLGIITEMVTRYGIGMIALADRVSQPEIQALLGIQYLGSWESSDAMVTTGDHFLTREIVSPLVADPGPEVHMKRGQVELSPGTVPLILKGPFVQATAREFASGGRTVWIGNDSNHMFSFQGLRTMLRRAITWTVGYSLYKTWENDAVMIMDDPGGAQNAWLKHWHYAPLSESVIEKYLIKPLQEHNAVLNINFVPAFVNDAARQLEPTWNQKFTDGFGLQHDNIASKAGFVKGIREGVFEVMCHGLTHMQPDLVSAPGWYGAGLEQEKSEVGWYREFGDTRRHKEIPAAEQLWRMKTGMRWLQEQFGVTPLEFCPGGLGTSVSYFNSTPKLAAQAGFGWCGWETGYLGKDMVIITWQFFGTPESPLLVPALPDAHDFGIAREPEVFATVFDRYPGKRFIGINEFIGYLHASNTAGWNVKENKLVIDLNYDSHYCMDFGKRPTVWKLEFADWLLKEKGAVSSLKVDGTAVIQKGPELQVPAGTGSHTVEVSF